MESTAVLNNRKGKSRVLHDDQPQKDPHSGLLHNPQDVLPNALKEPLWIIDAGYIAAQSRSGGNLGWFFAYRFPSFSAECAARNAEE